MDDGFASLREGLRAFREENARWLTDYALYRALKKQFGGASWTDWPEEYRNRRELPAGTEEETEIRAEADYQAFVQYVFRTQWDGLRAYARAVKHGFVGTEEEWLNSIVRGPRGPGGRPNLLDNWCFVGGAAVNQRGEMLYEDDGYTVDRWIADITGSDAGGAGSVEVDGDGLIISQGAGDYSATSICQILENPGALAGRTVTVSVLCRTNVGESGFVLLANTQPYAMAFADAQGRDALITLTVPLPEELLDLAVYFYGAVTSGQWNHGILRAVKLEVGEGQTLAEFSDGEWVLSDAPPNYGMEKLKCQLSQADGDDDYANKTITFEGG